MAFFVEEEEGVNPGGGKSGVGLAAVGSVESARTTTTTGRRCAARLLQATVDSMRGDDANAEADGSHQGQGLAGGGKRIAPTGRPPLA